MKKTHLLLILLAAAGTQSCIVSKKKYDTLEAKRQKQVDSLNTIVGTTNADYLRHRSIFAENNARKDSRIDSLDGAVRRLSSDTLNLKSSLKDAKSDISSQKSKLASLEKELKGKVRVSDSLTSTLKTKDVRLNELETMIGQNKAMLEQVKATINAALSAFDKSELTVYAKDGKIFIAMEEKLLFKSGSAVIDSKGKDAVKKLAAVLGQNPDLEILIQGHTDNVGKPELNWKLSADRALSIVDIMLTDPNLAPSRITAAGRGMNLPIADNSSPEGRQKNRRIDIVLIPKLEPLLKMMNQ